MLTKSTIRQEVPVANYGTEPPWAIRRERVKNKIKVVFVIIIYFLNMKDK